MKAGKPGKPGKDHKEDVVLTGKIVKKKIAQGSKSEHDGVYLETADSSFQIRRLGANPFLDPELKKLIGKKVSASGTLHGTMFLAKTVKKIT